MSPKSLPAKSKEVDGAAQCVAAHVDCDPQIEIIRIISMNPLPVSIGDGEWAADWDRIEWGEMQLVGESLIDSICRMKGIPRDEIKSQTIYSDPTAGRSVASVSYHAPADVAGLLQDSIRSISRSFMGRVIGGNPTANLFDSSLSPEENFRVDELARSFLEKCGGKRISAPIQVRQGEVDIGEYTGSFAKKPASQPLPDTGIRETIGVITMIDSTNKIVRVVESSGQERKFLFSGDTFRSEIFNSARDSDTCRIEWQLLPRLKCEPIPTLIRIERINSD